jgi:hypothetical protein
MGIEDEKIDQIIEEHVAVTDALKEQRDKYKADADKLPEVQKKLDEIEDAGDDGFEQKYNDEHKAFEDYKAQVKAEKDSAEKSSLYKQLLTDAGIDPKRIDAVMKVTDLKEVKVKDGAIEGAEDITKNIKTEWEAFLTQPAQKGAKVDTPPTNGNTKKPEVHSLADAMRAKYSNNE